MNKNGIFIISLLTIDVYFSCPRPYFQETMSQRPEIGDEHVNFFRVQLLTIEGGRKVLLRLLEYRTRGIEQSLKNNEKKLKGLYTKKERFTKPQWLQLFPNPKIEEWDIALIISLLQTIGEVKSPKCSPLSLPEDDVTVGADLLRMRKIRNEIQGHIPRAQISEVDFDALQTKITTVLKRLANAVSDSKSFNREVKDDIVAYLNRSLDPDLERKMLETMRTWSSVDQQENQNEILVRLNDLSGKFDNIPSIMEEQGEQFLKVLETSLNEIKERLNILKGNLQSDKMKDCVLSFTDDILKRVRNQMQEAKENMRNNLHTCLIEIKQLIDQIIHCYNDLNNNITKGFKKQNKMTETSLKKQDVCYQTMKSQHRKTLKELRKLKNCLPCFENVDKDDDEDTISRQVFYFFF